MSSNPPERKPRLQPDVSPLGCPTWACSATPGEGAVAPLLAARHQAEVDRPPLVGRVRPARAVGDDLACLTLVERRKRGHLNRVLAAWSPARPCFESY